MTKRKDLFSQIDLILSSKINTQILFPSFENTKVAMRLSTCKTEIKMLMKMI